MGYAYDQMAKKIEDYEKYVEDNEQEIGQLEEHIRVYEKLYKSVLEFVHGSTVFDSFREFELEPGYNEMIEALEEIRKLENQ